MDGPIGGRRRVPVARTVAGLAAVALAVLVAAGAVAACGGSAESAGPAVYTAADDGRTVEAAVGDTIEVRLTQNPSTGYAWEVTASDGLSTEADDFVAPSASPELVGAPGTRVLMYEVTAAGTQSIAAVYARSWEAGAGGDEQQFSLTIAVE
jgi:predicted secreted protein